MRTPQNIEEDTEQNTEQGQLGRRLNRTIGAIAIAAGLSVAGMSATTHAVVPTSTTLELHNTTAGSNGASGSSNCGPDSLDSTKSYWHFIVSTNDYTFVSITLRLSPPDTTITFTNGSGGAIISGKQAYIPVPTGYSLTSLQASSTADVTPAVAEGDQPLFNLSHTCSAVSTEETTPPTEATTPPTQATTAPTQASTAPTQATTAPTQASTAPTQAAMPAPLVPTVPSTTANSQVASEAPVVVPTTAVASQAMSAPNDVSLPVTGSNTASGIAIGVAMVGAGLVLSTLSRRRTARTGV